MIGTRNQKSMIKWTPNKKSKPHLAHLTTATSDKLATDGATRMTNKAQDHTYILTQKLR